MDMDFAVSGPRVRRSRLVPGFCPSTRTFALRFLQTSPRGDSPCVVANPSPPSGWVEDFHLRATEHAQHTTIGRKPAKTGHGKTKKTKRNPTTAVRRPSSSVADLQYQVTSLARELAEAREQQTASSEVLQVISSSPGELSPVFKVMLENATRICEAKLGVLFLWEGQGQYRVAALHGASARLAQERRPGTIIRPPPSTGIGRVASTRQVAHVPDVSVDKNYVDPPPGYSPAGIVIHAGARTELAVPMLKDDNLVGTIVIYRTEVRPFADKQIELVQNFAAQAVIAIENTRLLNELRESLQQQTATADVLKVISRSTFDLQTVLDTLSESAVRLCDADHAWLARRDSGAYRVVASFGHAKEEHAAIIEFFLQHPFSPGRGTVIGRTALEGRPVHVVDYFADPELEWRVDPQWREAQRIGKYRTALGVPLLREGVPIGVLAMTRSSVRPFTEKQIELATTFADQAVIAIENVRLFDEVQARTRELTEALEQQTATADVLQVISSSPGALEPVFQAMLEKAVSICAAKFGTLYLCDADAFRMVATHNAPPAYVEARTKQFRPHPDAPIARAARAKQAVQIADIRTTQAYTEGFQPIVEAAELGGYRTILSVPMFKEDELIGAINILRQEVHPFTDKQIELVKNFANQAVIAIENTRLLNELRQRTDDLSEALEQQTASSEVLQIISSSPGELEPVFQAMLANAVRICDARFGNLALFDGSHMRVAAFHNAPAAFEELRRRDPVVPLDRSVLGSVVETRGVVRLADLAADDRYVNSSLYKLAGARTVAAVPMLRDEELVGAIVIYRTEVRPFSDKQVELLTNFAAQAVIALENARLLNELRESLQQQTATAEVLKVISRSAFNLKAVLNTLVQSAVRLCEADIGHIARPSENGFFQSQANFGWSAELKEELESHPYKPGRESVTGRSLLECAPVQILDAQTDPEYKLSKAQQLGGYRTMIGAPLLRQGTPIGIFGLARKSVRRFTDKQIELLTTFADQAVIAIENVRLFEEVQARTRELSEALEQQTATSEVLQVISSSPGALQPVFQAILANAIRLSEAKFGVLFLSEGDGFRSVALHDVPAGHAEARRREPILRPAPEHPLGRLAQLQQTIHVPDIREEQGYRDGYPPLVSLADVAGARTLLIVPMMKERELVGAITIYKQAVRPFTEKQVELVGDFAAQGVIAIQNSRLLNELRESLQQQTATADVLKVISRSTFDLQTVLDTLVESAANLCEADMATINRPQGDVYRQVATYGHPSDFKAYIEANPLPPGRGSIVGRVIMECRTVQVADVLADPSYKMIEQAKMGGIRTVLGVPMLREGTPIGVIILQRKAVRPFTVKQIELVATFADQAVIAIENVRLFDEVQARTRELTEALEQQTATADVLQVISSSPGELEPVFQAMLENATRICDAKFGTLFRFDGQRFHLAAGTNLPPVFAEFQRKRGPFLPDAGTQLDIVLRT